MYNFNYFSPYVKPKSKKGYYLAVLGLNVIIALGILMGITFFMKMKIKQEKDTVNSIVSQINDPKIAEDIQKGKEFKEKIFVVNNDIKACNVMFTMLGKPSVEGEGGSSIEDRGVLNAVRVSVLDTIRDCLTDDSLLLNATFDEESIKLDVATKYEAYVPMIQVMDNLKKTKMFTGVYVPSTVDPYYYNKNSFEYLVFPLILNQYGGQN